jgi:mannosyl-3-phosphoglycerate phosphatase
MIPARILVFTDLDGTLLDHQSYSAKAAEAALRELKRRRVPVVFVTSKTRAEVEVIRRELENTDPFITENGGGVFIPQEYFQRRIEGEVRIGRYHVLALGRPYEEVAAALEEIATEAGAEVVGFRQMSAKEVAENTGLSREKAQLAKKRDFDEPFYFVRGGEDTEKRLEEAAILRGMNVTRGGRFWHLTAGSHKGKAVKKLIELFRSQRQERMRTVGLGDSEVDLPMLAAMDVAFLLPNRTGGHDEKVMERLPRVKKVSEPGPAGWSEVMLRLI